MDSVCECVLLTPTRNSNMCTLKMVLGKMICLESSKYDFGEGG